MVFRNLFFFYVLGSIFLLSACMLPATAIPNPGVPNADPTKILRLGLEKNKTLRSYRAIMSIRLGYTNLTTWRGEVSERNAHFTYSDYSVQDAEVIRVAGRVYQRNGKVNGADEWLLVPTDEVQPYQSESYSPRGEMSDFGNALSGFDNAERAPLDDLECDVYRRDALADPSVAKSYEQAETKIWLCADGFIHQIKMLYKVKVDNKPGVVQTDVTVHLYDFNAEIQIAAPARFKPFPTATAMPQVPLLPTSTLSSAHAAQELLREAADWKPVLKDSFDDNENHWTSYSGRIINGKYVWTITDRGNAYRGLPQMENVNEFVASVDAKFLDGAPDCEYGIVFEHAVSGSERVLLIDKDSHWRFETIRFGQGVPLAGKSEAIHADAVNRLTVIAHDTRYRFFVNGEFIAETSDVKLSRGGVGVGVWIGNHGGGCRVEFDNFELRAND